MFDVGKELSTLFHSVLCPNTSSTLIDRYNGAIGQFGIVSRQDAQTVFRLLSCRDINQSNNTAVGFAKHDRSFPKVFIEGYQNA